MTAGQNDHNEGQTDAKEESKTASTGKKKKTARNRTKMLPAVTTGDYIADDDDTELKEALAKTLQEEGDDEEEKD